MTPPLRKTMLCAAGALLSMSAADAAVSMNWLSVGDAGNVANSLFNQRFPRVLLLLGRLE